VVILLILHQQTNAIFGKCGHAELADEVATLPLALRSDFPDLAVDFLYTVFKDSADEEVKRYEFDICYAVSLFSCMGFLRIISPSVRCVQVPGI